MFNLKELKKAVEQIAQEKGVEAKKVFEALEASLAAAYKKEYCQRGEVVKAKFDQKTGGLKFWKIKTVVDDTTVRIVEEEPVPEGGAPENESRRAREEFMPEGEDVLPRYNPDRHIFLEEAKKEKPDVILGEELIYPLETHDDFGRIAAQTAKQVILQKLREAERNSILEEFHNKEGEIISGVIQRYDRGNVYVDLGRATGIMFYNESIPGEHYTVSDRMRFYILAVQEESRIPGIILSRSHPKFVSRLFELEVPEIADGVVEIKAIAREPGSRSKIAVVSKTEGIDPVGSCVGQRGTRVMAVSNELGQEKIDIIEWSEDPAKFITNALSPAKVTGVEILPRREAKTFVPDDQLSLAIGKGGQNVRLAAKLTSWKIDVRSQSKPDEVLEGGVAAAIPTEEVKKGLEENKEEKSAEEKSPEAVASEIESQEAKPPASAEASAGKKKRGRKKKAETQ
ncbi:MAG: transcription termination/antitermination protein NusA [Candidatus Harrisonbacteria bacterium]|nr:transcription termination/antitermination protein NusA [Candidatus Harrisonbacteria bacterium]